MIYIQILFEKCSINFRSKKKCNEYNEKTLNIINLQCIYLKVTKCCKHITLFYCNCFYFTLFLISEIIILIETLNSNRKFFYAISVVCAYYLDVLNFNILM